MKYLSILFLLPAIAVSQIFPGAVATNSNLYVASDQATSSLSAAIGASDLSIGVFSASKFRPFNVITIDSEQIKICSISGNIFTVCSGGRGFAGTNAVSHNKGTSVANFVSSIYHNTMATELESVETWLNPGTGVRIGNGTSQVTNLPQLDVPHGGLGVSTIPAGSFIVGNSASPVQTYAPGTPLTYLRSTPNVTTPAFQSSPLNTIEAPDYNFNGISVGVTLNAGTPATITIPYAPIGVSGTNSNHYLLIAGGVGTLEAVLITGGTCVSGTVGNCTLQFTPANAHSGGWSIGSATAGLQESLNVSFSTTGYVVHAPSRVYDIYAPIAGNIVGQRVQTIHGDGTGYFNQAFGTIIINHGVGTPAFSLVGDLVNNACEAAFTISNLTIRGSPTSGTGISASNACMLRVDHVFEVGSQLFGLSCGPNCYTVTITDSFFYSNGREGISISDAANEVHLDRVASQTNCQQAAGISCSGIHISNGSTNALNVTVTNSGFALDGIQPTSGYSSIASGARFSGVNALQFSGNYCEQELTHCVQLDGATSGFDIRGNYFQQGGISVATGVTGGSITGNYMISGSQVLSIANVTSNGGFCQITTTLSPTVPFTVGAFESLVGITGALACNDTAFDNSAVIQSVQSTNQFTTGRPGGGGYVSGGTAEKSSGYSVGGGASYADIHIFGNSINTSVGNVLTVGGDLLPGYGAIIFTASVVSINHQYHHVSGAGTIQTVTPPSGYAGQWCSVADTNFSVGTAGNFAVAASMTTGQMKCWSYDPTTSKWY